MRDVPAGIELRRVTRAELPHVMDVVQNGILGYREWAPDWTPFAPPPETMDRLNALWEDEEKAWGLLAFAGADPVAVISMSVTTAADQRVPAPGTIYLWQMFVAPGWQGRGLAGALLDRLFEEARRRGYERVVLWAAEGAAQARRFYEREGFTLTGEKDPESGFGLPLVQYGRDL